MPKLLSKDYQDIVKETFKLPEGDFENYYLNTVNTYINENKEVVECLLKAIANFKTWFHQQKPNISAWEVDEFGNEIPIDYKSIQIPLFKTFGIKRHIDIVFFELQENILFKINEVFKNENRVEDRSAIIKLEDKSEEEDNFPKTKFIPSKFRDLLKVEYQSKTLAFMQILHVADSPVVDMPNHISKDCKELVPLLSEAGDWIGNRQAARVFYEALLLKGVVVKVPNTTYAKVFKKAFKINSSFVTQKPIGNAILYDGYFKKKIDEIVTEITNRNN
jgi:hypothetical protein